MKKRKKFHVMGFVFVFFLISGVFAQQQEYIAGKVLDSVSQEPLVFANVRIKDRALGVITNVDGSFKIPLKYKEYGDIIEISSMGYLTTEVLISELDIDKFNIIVVKPSAIDLQEAIVKGKRKRNLSAKQIVQRAIDAIPRNYPSKSFSSIGYYRDYQFKGGEYINLSETILEVFDQGFDQLDDSTSKTRLFNFELNKDFKQDSMARAAYDYVSNRKIIKKAHLDAHGGNEFRILRIHDAIRNYNVGAYDFIGALKTDLIENHEFLRSRDTRINNEQLYGIKFWTQYPNYSAYGKIYISKADYSIYKLEYTMYDKNAREKGGEKNKHGHRQKVIFDVVTDYKKIADKMYLNYISFHNSFEIRKPPKFELDSTLVSAPGGYYELYFNKPVDTVSAKKLKNYNILYKQRKLGIEKIKIDQNVVIIYPDDFKKQMENARGEINTLIRKNEPVENQFYIQVKNIKDTDGGIVNEFETDDYLQYREFFVQRVKLDSRAPFDVPFMNKRKAIFDNQPFSKPKDYREYWMNTPFKDVNN